MVKATYTIWIPDSIQMVSKNYLKMDQIQMAFEKGTIQKQTIFHHSNTRLVGYSKLRFTKRYYLIFFFL